MMPTQSNEADGDGAAVMTPKATYGRASAASISKEDERRRKLQEWKESKASEKKVFAPERKTVPDRKAQFFERRERRLEEEKKKRLSRSGKENSSSTPTTMTDPKSRVTPSAVASRLLSTPRPGQGPDAQGRLIGTTPVSATRGPPPRARQAATTPSSGAKGASSHAGTVAAVTTASAGARGTGTGGVEAVAAPSRSSALLRPKASPYKEKSQPNALKTAAAASGTDEPPGRPSTTPGDRLSGQLARLGAAGASSRREGRFRGGSGAGGVAAGAAARRETFQGSRACSTTDEGAAGVVRARPTFRRVSSAMLASDAVVSSSEIDKRRLASSVVPKSEDQHQGPSTPAPPPPTAAPTTNTPKTCAVQPLRISVRSPNEPSTAGLQLHPTGASPKQNAVLSSDASSSSTTEVPAPVTTASVDPRTSTTTNAVSDADVEVGQRQENKAAKAVAMPDNVQEKASVKAVVTRGISEKMTTASQSGTTKVVGHEEPQLVGSVADSEVVAMLAKDGADTLAAGTATAAASAAGTVTAVGEKGVGEVWCWQAPSPSPRLSSDGEPMSFEGGKKAVGQGAGLIARANKSDPKITEERQKGGIREGAAEGAAATPTEAVSVPAKLGQTQRASLPAAPVLAATTEAPPAGTAAVAAAAKNGEEEPVAEDSAPAAILSFAEVAAALNEDGSVAEQKLSVFSRFSSVFSRRQQSSASTTMYSTGASDDGSAFAIAAQAKKIPSQGSPTVGLDNTGEKSSVALTGGAKPTKEADDHPAAAPSAAEAKLREGCPARQSPDDTNGLVASQVAAATRPAAAPFSGSTLPGNHSKLSSPPAGRTYSPREKGRIEPPTQAAEQTTAGPYRPRPALTPPGYRSRPSPPPADRTDALQEEGSVDPTSWRSKEATTPSSPVPRPTRLTPPGYLSRLSPPSAGTLGSVRGHSGKENEANCSTGARSSGLTPPGYRSRLSPLSARGMESPSRETLEVDPASCSLSAVRGSEVEKLTPDHRHTGAPACARHVGGSESTPPRGGDLPCPEASSPPLEPLEEPKRELSRGTGPADEDEDKKAEAGEKDVGCSPIGIDGGAGRPEHGVSQQYSSRCTANDHASTQTLLAGVVASPGTSSPHAQQQQQQQQQQEMKEEVQTKDTACSTTSRGSSREDVPGRLLNASSPAEQQQRPPATGSADADARKGEDNEEGEKITQDAMCSPMACDGGSPTGGSGSPECSTPRFGTARIASSPPTARSAAAVLEGTSVGVGSPVAADAQPLSPGGVRAVGARVSPPPPPPPKDEDGRGQEDGSPTKFHHCSPNFAAGFVAGRRKRRAVSGVPVVAAAAAAASAEESPGGGHGDSGSRVSSRLETAKQSQEERTSGGEDAEEGEGEDEESSSGESGSSWETCSSSEEDEEEGKENWGGLSYLDEINEHPYTGGVVIDPDLVRSGSSSNGGGSTRSSLLRSSFGEARSGGRRSWGLKPRSVVTAEMGTQTGEGEGAKHALVQAGDGKLLSEAELQDECDLSELRERLEMMNHDRLSEVFHREIVKQEEAQKRKKLSEKNDAECLKLREENEALKLAHNNEKIRIRWEHADELARVEVEAGDGAGLMEELQEERRLREQDREHHVAALQKERQQRREWEARHDDLVREKREQAKQRSEEIRNQVAAEKKKLEALKKKLERQHREAQKKAEELVKEQLQALKEIDEENDELREENDGLRKENAQLREKLGMEVEDEEEEEEEEEEGGL